MLILAKKDYSKLGFKKMNTAMAIFQNEEEMIKNGTLSER
jgi:hypothetical protein